LGKYSIFAGASAEDAEWLRKVLLKQHLPRGRNLTRNPDDLLADNWRDGGYPNLYLMSRKNYERQKLSSSGQTAQTSDLGRGNWPAGAHPVRGPRCGGQGRHHLALHGNTSTHSRARCCTGKTLRNRTRTGVFSALRAATADCRRNDLARPLMVQPCGIETGNGILHR
jgi:hypothetical protein